MTAIIIEGPDESGKTTLATALLGYFGDDAGYLRSPARKDPGWSQYYNSWVGRIIDDKRKLIHILDRIPEISEMVYGPIVRDKCRLSNPLASILGLPTGVKVIFCQFPKDRGLQDTHVTADGRTVNQALHLEIIGGYLVAEQIVRPNSEVYRWYYWESEKLWSDLLRNLVAGYTLTRPDITFDVALALGKEMMA